METVVRRSRRFHPIFVAVLVASVGVVSPVAADSGVVSDQTDASDSPTDIASAGHGHATGEGILRHEIRFDGQPDSVAEVVSFFFRFRNKAGHRRRRELQVRANPDGGLYGVFTNRQGDSTGYSRAWMEEPSTLVVEFSARTLGGPSRGYDWHVWTILGTGEFDDPCAGEDVGPPVCKDRAPTQGWIRHRVSRRPLSLVLNQPLREGGRTRVKLRNSGELTYIYNPYYEACEMVFRHASGGRFLIPEGTHCDLQADAEVAPGETVTLFKWDLNECTEDNWGCLRSKDLFAGKYLMHGWFKPKNGGNDVRVTRRFRILKR